jgi:putative flippase GtrA
MSPLFRYFLVGGAAALTDLSLFFLLAQIAGLPYLAVGALSFLVATYVNYILSIRFVFRSGSRFSKGHEMLLVFAVSAVGLLVHQVVLYCTVDIFKLPLMLAKVTATGSVFFWNFGVRRYFIFRPTTLAHPETN